MGERVKGYVQVYTGDGKGKSSAALGVVVRACGAGLRVYMGQFIKRGLFSEIRTLRDRFPDVRVEQYGRGRFIRSRPDARDVQAARGGYKKLRNAMACGDYDIVIADEIGPAVTAGRSNEFPGGFIPARSRRARECARRPGPARTRAD